MSLFCPLWRGFHKWETPKYQKGLELRGEVIKKCQCGETKNEIRYVPAQDTEEYESYQGFVEYDDESEDYDRGINIQNVVSFIFSIIIFGILFTTIFVPLIQEVVTGECSSFNISGRC